MIPVVETILIIDDEQSILDFLEYAIRREGYRPLVAKTGEDGLAIARQANPSLVLLDVKLPGINGIEVLRQLRLGSNVPVIMLTAKDTEVDKIVGLEMGADDYVPKPFSPRELVARMKAILRRIRPTAPKTAPAGPVASGDFVVEKEKFRITFQGHILPLSKTEFAIIETLLAHPGRVYSRNELLDMAFGKDAVSMDRTIDAHIRNIRRKIEAVDKKANPIETKRGVGYSLKEV